MSTARPITPGLFRDEPDGPRLLAGRCAACSRLHFPATSTCPYCGTADATPAAIGARGTLWLWTVVSTRPPGYRGPVPFGFGVVELADDGLRVVTRLTEADLASLRHGLPMRLVLDTLFTDDEGADVVSYAYQPEHDA
ncbi:MAG TPA: OB-fold domain-containing protein [Candidatus Binatia bacterium]|jgi:uncharacterized OB-fold protein|nr:OB-fold domain-containing protein [Candidatus Binatia bacterium]